jgi:hypothetical protein
MPFHNVCQHSRQCTDRAVLDVYLWVSLQYTPAFSTRLLLLLLLLLLHACALGLRAPL